MLYKGSHTIELYHTLRYWSATTASVEVLDSKASGGSVRIIFPMERINNPTTVSTGFDVSSALSV
jgi:hypothetical protein